MATHTSLILPVVADGKTLKIGYTFSLYDDFNILANAGAAGEGELWQVSKLPKPHVKLLAESLYAEVKKRSKGRPIYMQTSSENAFMSAIAKVCPKLFKRTAEYRNNNSGNTVHVYELV